MTYEELKAWENTESSAFDTDKFTRQGNKIFGVPHHISEAVKQLEGEEMDIVNKPAHYTSGNYEVIDILKDQLTPEQFKGFLRGNVLKYVLRYDKKNGKEDLQKAQWYLNKLIESY